MRTVSAGWDLELNSGQIKHDWVFEFIIKLRRNECVGCMERNAIT